MKKTIKETQSYENKLGDKLVSVTLYNQKRLKEEMEYYKVETIEELIKELEQDIGGQFEIIGNE